MVSPLLALLLADGKSLVLQVMPPALLDFSRGVMRQALSDSVGKRVCTLLFERNDLVDARLFHKLSNAAASGAVVSACCNPLPCVNTLVWHSDSNVCHGMRV